MQDKLALLLNDMGFEIFGFCGFKDTGGLFETKNKSKIPENAQSIITFLFPYKIPCKEKNLSIYCIGKDYHTIISNKLEKCVNVLKENYPQNNFEYFCDNSPINEVRAAYLSGLGMLGKNGLIINEKYGSYCFIGEIVTDLKLSPSVCKGECLNCGKCLESCPASALFDDGGKTYRLDRTKCISALTQKKGELTAEQEALIKKGGLIWGCDGCLESCPLNGDARDTDIKEFYQDALFILGENEIETEHSDRAYGYKGKEILKRNLRIIGG